AQKLTVCVLPGRFATLAQLFFPVSALISDDVPTLDRPARATSVLRCTGYPSGPVALVRKRAWRNTKALPPGASRLPGVLLQPPAGGRALRRPERHVHFLPRRLLRGLRRPQREFEDLVHVVDKVNGEGSSHFRRHLVQVLLVLLGNEDRGDPGPVRRQHFLL